MAYYLFLILLMQFYNPQGQEAYKGHETLAVLIEQNCESTIKTHIQFKSLLLGAQGLKETPFKRLKFLRSACLKIWLALQHKTHTDFKMMQLIIQMFQISVFVITSTISPVIWFTFFFTFRCSELQIQVENVAHP